MSATLRRLMRRVGMGITQSPALYYPARALGELFHDAEMAAVFPDSKTFVDARPRETPADVVARYHAERGAPGFSLRHFIERHFHLPGHVGADIRSDTTVRMESHLRGLWPALTRSADHVRPYSSLLPLPNQYVVPGGRFREVYYWDSYFTMLGLLECGHVHLACGMLDNFAAFVRTLGYIPNANRTYYLSRSQPPYFSAMVGLYAQAAGMDRALGYLDAMEAEHAFWMDGAGQLAPGEAYRRVARLPDGGLLNRHWDDVSAPRPESYREDVTLAQDMDDAQRDRFYRNVRAAAESGWDFSSRWMRDPSDLRTLEVTDLAPVDLNAVLYDAERTIAAMRRARGLPGDAAVADRYDADADARRTVLMNACWDARASYAFDVRWATGEPVSDRPTLAPASLLYFGLPSPEQGTAIAARFEREFLCPGGFVTSLVTSGQQWDCPNGWAPLQWLAIEGTRRYGRHDLADLARARWLTLNRRVYRSTGRMMEKYDVIDAARIAGGGEYPTQDGFGWTNGVALALSAQRLR